MASHGHTLQAAIFDWAGTMVDFGSRAPAGAFVDVFADAGITITVADARGPMGLPKLDHIRALGRLPTVQAQWQSLHGAPFDDAAAQAIYAAYVPRNAGVVADFAELVPGAADLVRTLRDRGIRIGSTTGYSRDIMERLLPKAADQGYVPDTLVCAGDLAAGRPTPLMMYKCFVDLGLWQPHRVVKVDDTTPGIEEGNAAGCWTVGVSLSGNAVGLSPDALAAADPDAVARLNDRARQTLIDGGAHHVIDTVADLPAVIDRIEAMLAAGQAPHRF